MECEEWNVMNGKRRMEREEWKIKSETGNSWYSLPILPSSLVTHRSTLITRLRWLRQEFEPTNFDFLSGETKSHFCRELRCRGSSVLSPLRFRTDYKRQKTRMHAVSSLSCRLLVSPQTISCLPQKTFTTTPNGAKRSS